MDTLATELREAASAIDRVAHEQRCWSMISEAVGACISHISAIAGNVEKNHRIMALEAIGAGTGAPSYDPLAVIERMSLGPVQRSIAVALALRFGRWTSTEQLVAAAYSARPDGGPIDAVGSIAVTVSVIRRKLRLSGLTIEGAPYSGRRMVRA